MINNVTDLSKVIIGNDDVLIEVASKTDSGLILPEKSKDPDMISHAEILKVGSGVKDLSVGDYILAFHRDTYMFEWKDKRFTLTTRANIKLACPKEYYVSEPVKKNSKLNV